MGVRTGLERTAPHRAANFVRVERHGVLATAQTPGISFAFDGSAVLKQVAEADMSARRFVVLLPAVILAALLLLGCGAAFSVQPPASDSGSDVVADQGVPQETGAMEAGQLDAIVADGGPSVDGFAAAAHPAFPRVPNTSGRTMMDSRLVTILASNDVPTDGTDTQASLEAFSHVLPGSAVWDAASSEYHLGSLSVTTHVNGPAIDAGSYTLADLESYVAGGIGAGAVPSPDGNTIYLVYLPAGAEFSGTYANDCAYHQPYPVTASAGDALAVVRRCKPYPDQETQLGELTRSASHEIVEAASDPLGKGYNLGTSTAQPWDASAWQGRVSVGLVELGDMCQGTRTFEPKDGGPPGGWEFQRVWSNAAAAAGGDPCVPSLGEPYYSVSAPQGWYRVQAGGHVDIPLTGWSPEATSDWLLNPNVAVSRSSEALADGGTGFAVVLTTEAGVGTVPPCYARYAMNNAVGAVARVTASASAQSGDFVVLQIDSFREKPAPSCDPPISEDQYHFWPVGVYVQ
jgi:hypothetical protein